MAIKTTIMGIIALNPKLILEQGIRKELVNKGHLLLTRFSLQFPQLGSIVDFRRIDLTVSREEVGWV